MLTGSSCLNLAPTERGTDSSMPRQAWLLMPMEISLLLIGATAGSRLASEKLHLADCWEIILKVHGSHAVLSSLLQTRYSTAPGPSCPTLTHQRTPFMVPRAWPSLLMATWRWPTLETTASRFTATFSRDARRPSSAAASTDDDTTNVFHRVQWSFPI